MQVCKEKNNQRNRKHRKLITGYPKKMPTYVVAYAMNQTYDESLFDSSTILERKTSSLDTLSPTGSSKINLDSIINVETKIDIDGNVEFVEESLKTNVFTDETNVEDLKQPQILFDSKKSSRRKIQRKRSKNYNRTVKIRNIHFKTKNTKITKKIQKYYLDKRSTAAQIKTDIYSNCLSKVVSRDRMVKNTLAKENLLEAINQEPNVTEAEQNAETDSIADQNTDADSIISSSTSSAANSFMSANSFTSQFTLVNKDSESSKSDDSVIEVAQNEALPYKADVTAMAVTKLTRKQNMIELMNEKLVCKESLTSEEFPLSHVISLTSKPLPSVGSTKSFTENKLGAEYLQSPIDSNETSDVTLLPSGSPGTISNISSTRFEIARTSSDFHKESTSDDSSNCTQLTNSDTTMRPDNLALDGKETHIMNTNLFEKLNSVLSIGPTVVPSTSTGDPTKLNDVIVTEDKLLNIPLELMTDKCVMNTNIFKKTFEGDAETPLKPFNLPNGAAIQNMLNNAKQKFTCSQELNSPSALTDMWDKISVVLDVVVKRLEESLADKILKEIKILTRSQYPNATSIEAATAPSITNAFIIEKETKMVAEKEVLVGKTIEEDKSFQCSLVDNKFIDNLMLKLSMDGPKFAFPIKSGPVNEVLKEPELKKDYVKVLKSPEKTIVIEDTPALTSSTVSPEIVDERISKYKPVGRIFAIPAAFLRENMFVLATIPSFFVFMFLLYTVFMLIVKVW